jgi:hypothetical protein
MPGLPWFRQRRRDNHLRDLGCSAGTCLSVSNLGDDVGGICLRVSGDVFGNARAVSSETYSGVFSPYRHTHFRDVTA